MLCNINKTVGQFNKKRCDIKLAAKDATLQKFTMLLSLPFCDFSKENPKICGLAYLRALCYSLFIDTNKE